MSISCTFVTNFLSLWYLSLLDFCPLLQMHFVGVHIWTCIHSSSLQFLLLLYFIHSEAFYCSVLSNLLCFRSCTHAAPLCLE
ncbi:hypothetical protein CPB84DRAFT_746762 [Gymnopilus junonius]|uniref:Uncharacterized protein n=1 Tax=Gymnopilus junonius TaxID=109634 RepID=A0A9P5NZZ3_GYMJU|nr:hypothetical protein CPB84DRAFT_746762 [Gymnopilus junonius]